MATYSSNRSIGYNGFQSPSANLVAGPSATVTVNIYTVSAKNYFELENVRRVINAGVPNNETFLIDGVDIVGPTYGSSGNKIRIGAGQTLSYRATGNNISGANVTVTAMGNLFIDTP